LGKARSKNHDADEYYKGQIRELKSINRRLERQLKEVLKHQSTKSKNDCKKESKENICQNCGKGILESVDLGIRIITSCPLCGYRESIKK